MSEHGATTRRPPSREEGRPSDHLAEVRRVLRTVGEACRTCPDRATALRREWLCRCRVALAVRCLQAAEQFGGDPDALPSHRRHSLALQERMLAADPPPFDAESLARAADALAAVHPGSDCGLGGCLTCRARGALTAGAED